MTGQEIENEIKAAGADVAPRVTLADIEAQIDNQAFFTAADGVLGANGGMVETDSPLHRLTFCVLVLRNGYALVGKSACVSPENFNPEIGRKVAREDAINQAWPLFGYALAERLYQAK